MSRSRLAVDIQHEVPGFALAAAFNADPGITVLFGPSGAGKTMLVDVLAGLVSPQRGRIAIGDNVLFDADRGINLPPERRRVGYVFQDARLLPHMTVESNLRFGWRRQPPERRSIEFSQVVKLLGLEGLIDRRTRDLSGGEKQRVALGRAMLTSPRVLLMDEPLASLDHARRHEILPFIERLRDEFEIPIVYVTHSIDELVRLAATVVLLDRGRLVAAGNLEELMRRLDLAAYTGGADAGAVLMATIVRHDERFELTYIAFHGGELAVPRLGLDVGRSFRVRIHARDVALATFRPVGLSTLNVIPGKITAIVGTERAPQVDILLDVGVPLWARITRKSAVDLRLTVGAPVYALIKSIAFDSDR
ncbi:MAG: molybdenum ABC transporter ATP-binding protein [Alphaproteobacteria bacterium]|nr:molybdenum ABC transporter ATP-binding protein [Alphaproteobacteria bacterium]